MKPYRFPRAYVITPLPGSAFARAAQAGAKLREEREAREREEREAEARIRVMMGLDRKLDGTT